MAFFSRKDSTLPSESLSSRSKRGRDARASGYLAEEQATELLTRQGVEILAKNFRCKGGEIDIVGQQDGTLLFIEVRLRSSIRFGTPSESITHAKQRRIVLAAQVYLQRNSRLAKLPCRFDCVLMSGSSEPEWIRDAFRLD